LIFPLSEESTKSWFQETLQNRKKREKEKKKRKRKRKREKWGSRH